MKYTLKGGGRIERIAYRRVRMESDQAAGKKLGEFGLVIPKLVDAHGSDHDVPKRFDGTLTVALWFGLHFSLFGIGKRYAANFTSHAGNFLGSFHLGR